MMVLDIDFLASGCLLGNLLYFMEKFCRKWKLGFVSKPFFFFGFASRQTTRAILSKPINFHCNWRSKNAKLSVEKIWQKKKPNDIGLIKPQVRYFCLINPICFLFFLKDVIHFIEVVGMSLICVFDIVFIGIQTFGISFELLVSHSHRSEFNM